MQALFRFWETASPRTIAPIARRPGLIGRPSVAGPKRPSKPEARTVVLRRDGEQAQEAAAHCFLRTEAATLRDPFDRRARFRKQTPRPFHSQPLDGTRSPLPRRLRVVPPEPALPHARLIGQDRKRY